MTVLMFWAICDVRFEPTTCLTSEDTVCQNSTDVCRVDVFFVHPEWLLLLKNMEHLHMHSNCTYHIQIHKQYTIVMYIYIYTYWFVVMNCPYVYMWFHTMQIAIAHLVHATNRVYVSTFLCSSMFVPLFLKNIVSGWHAVCLYIQY